MARGPALIHIQQYLHGPGRIVNGTGVIDPDEKIIAAHPAVGINAVNGIACLPRPIQGRGGLIT